MKTVSFYIGALCLLTGSLWPASTWAGPQTRVKTTVRAPFFTTKTTDQIADCPDLTANPQKMSGLYQVETWPKRLSTQVLIGLPGSFPMESEGWTLEIFDIKGQRLRHIEGLRSRSYTLKRGNLDAGIYLLKVTQRQKLMGVTKVLAD